MIERMIQYLTRKAAFPTQSVIEIGLQRGGD